MPGRDTRELLRATRTGDRSALESLLQQHLPALRAFVRLRMSPLLRARESAEDLVQSTCAEFLLGLDGFDYRGEEAFRGWLYTAVLNTLRQHERSLRAQKRDARREVAVDETGDGYLLPVAAVYARALSPTQELMAAERVQQLEAAFDALPDDYREVLTLSRIARMRRAAIAEQMGRTEASVRSLLNRALAALALRLERVRAEGR
jgi:RNA polymerase sigma-70 factor (ECF subfamily)